MAVEVLGMVLGLILPIVGISGAATSTPFTLTAVALIVFADSVAASTVRVDPVYVFKLFALIVLILFY